MHDNTVINGIDQQMYEFSDKQYGRVCIMIISFALIAL